MKVLGQITMWKRFLEVFPGRMHPEFLILDELGPISSYFYFFDDFQKKKNTRISLNFHVPGPPQAFPRAPVTLGNLPTSIEIHTEKLVFFVFFGRDFFEKC